MFDWNGLYSNAIWAGAGWLGGYAWNRLNDWRKNRGQGAIFAGLEGPTLFVVPSRPGRDDRPLPHVSIEDFLAVNNIISAYLLIGRRPPRVVSHDRLTTREKEQHNLVLICSSLTNPVTKEAIELLRLPSNPFSPRIPYFENVPGVERQLQIRCNDACFLSPSYSQTGDRRDDFAIIMKAANPWAAQRKILVVAGARGIGTWGAAEFLKKGWKALYDKKSASYRLGTTKHGDFAAIVAIRYEEHDIKRTELKLLENLDAL